MSEPLPPDPYAALGVPKDADISQIRTAHRKLVLKYHPDRIKGDNAEDKERAKDEFQKVQQAYELLVDPAKRSRYEDQVRLAELVRERFMRPTRPSAQTTASTPGATFVRREVRRDGNFYEERAPPTSYFDDQHQYDEPLPRGASRKHEAAYEKDRKTSASKPAERREKPSPRPEAPSEAFTNRMNSSLRAKAAQAKERLRESHAKNQETRDREMRQERTEKQSTRRPVHAEVESDSDSATQVPRRSPRSTRPSTRSGPEPVRVREQRSPVRRGPYEDPDSYSEDEKWEQYHKRSMDYIAESKKRPDLARKGSDAYVYWKGDSRRGDSDSERRPTSSRRTKPDESKIRPSMPAHSSAPVNLKPFVEERVPPSRSKTNPVQAERDPRPINLNRSQTMPVHRSTKKDAAPSRGSNLKHSETQDSGYYSTSNPHTPEMGGESPPPSRENSRKKGSSVKYQIVTPESDDDRGSRVTVKPFLASDDEGRHRRYRSPDRDRDIRDRERERERERDRDRDRERERERDRSDRDRPRERERPYRTESDSRPRPSRAAPTSFPRGDFDRHTTNSPRGSPPGQQRKHLYGEISSDEKEAPPSRKYDPSSLKTASYRTATTTSFPSPRVREHERDYFPDSSFRENIRQPSGRRPSAAY